MNGQPKHIRKIPSKGSKPKAIRTELVDIQVFRYDVEAVKIRMPRSAVGPILSNQTQRRAHVREMGVLANHPIRLEEVHSVGDVPWKNLGFNLEVFRGAGAKHSYVMASDC